MLLMGDEMGRSQHGNNNAYCQDNELNWLDWSLKTRHGELFRFCRRDRVPQSSSGPAASPVLRS